MKLTAENLVFGYDRDVPVLRGVSLELQPGVVTVLFGANGCGKSTLLSCLNGSLTPWAGCVRFGEHAVNAMTAAELARHIAVVPQDTPADIPFTARQLVMLGRYAHWNAWGRESEQDRDIVEECLARVRADHLADRRVGRLSGGERQRVVIARALAQRGSVLLLDEPASHLDISHQLELYHLARELAKQGQAVLMVCHDVLLAPMIADVCVLMLDGVSLASGATTDVLSPANLVKAYGCELELAWPAPRCVSARFPSGP